LDNAAAIRAKENVCSQGEQIKTIQNTYNANLVVSLIFVVLVDEPQYARMWGRVPLITAAH